jgi:DNA-binding NtrC family response regulator
LEILADLAATHSGFREPGSDAVRDFSLSLKEFPPLSVLVVDDEPLIRWSLSETLTEQGYRAIEAGDARSALAILEHPETPIDIVLLDYRLPDATGLQVLAAIRRLDPRTGVVMMTAYGTTEICEEAMRLGAACVVNKPIEMDDVACLVQRARATRPA